jgi:hypothetical protein
MSGGPVEPIPPGAMLGASDWDDEDLLTIGEASQRLTEEISAVRRRIRHAEEILGDLESPAAGAPLSAERKRLAELMSAAERIHAARADAPK